MVEGYQVAGEKYADLAVDALRDYFAAYLQTHLTATETALSLTAGALPAPDEYIAAWLPEDNRNLLTVYCQRINARPDFGGLFDCSCVVSLEFSADADFVAGQLRARRMATAMLECLDADRTLGARVTQALEDSVDLYADKTADAQTRHAIEMTVSVTVQES